jgi:hypothetical protein
MSSSSSPVRVARRTRRRPCLQRHARPDTRLGGAVLELARRPGRSARVADEQQPLGLDHRSRRGRTRCGPASGGQMRHSGHPAPRVPRTSTRRRARRTKRRSRAAELRCHVGGRLADQETLVAVRRALHLLPDDDAGEERRAAATALVVARGCRKSEYTRPSQAPAIAPQQAVVRAVAGLSEGWPATTVPSASRAAPGADRSAAGLAPGAAPQRLVILRDGGVDATRCGALRSLSGSVGARRQCTAVRKHRKPGRDRAVHRFRPKTHRYSPCEVEPDFRSPRRRSGPVHTRLSSSPDGAQPAPLALPRRGPRTLPRFVREST